MEWHESVGGGVKQCREWLQRVAEISSKKDQEKARK